MILASNKIETILDERWIYEILKHKLNIYEILKHKLNYNSYIKLWPDDILYNIYNNTYYNIDKLWLMIW